MASSFSSDFKPNEQALRELRAMGFDEETATQALFFSGNSSTDNAVAWIFDNQGQSPNLERAFAGSWQPVEEIGDADVKMVIVANSALRMSSGKLAAQVAHAAIGLYRFATSDDASMDLRSAVRKWELEGETTIVLSGDNAPHLESLETRAKERGLAVCLVSDAGRTEVASGAKTVLGIFGEKNKVDKITGTLRTL